MKSLAVMPGGALEVVTVSEPRVENSSVICRTLACGVCNGTDGKLIHGKFKDMDTYPMLIGHEAVGEVVEVGKDVTMFKPGDKVLGPIIEGGIDGYASFWGGYSEYSVGRDWKAMAKNGIGPGTPGFPEGVYTCKAIPGDFDPVSGSVIITLREVLSACHHFGFKSGESLVVFGAGPVGLTFIKFAKLLGMGPVISVVRSDEKAAGAAKAGADLCFNSRKEDITAEIRRVLPAGADYVLDAAGSTEVINSGIRLVREYGGILVYGISPDKGMQIDWGSGAYDWQLHFYQFPVKAEEGAVHDQIINWIRMGVIDPADWVSHVFEFKDILSAFEIVERREPVKKIVIKY